MYSLLLSKKMISVIILAATTTVDDDDNNDNDNNDSSNDDNDDNSSDDGKVEIIATGKTSGILIYMQILLPAVTSMMTVAQRGITRQKSAID